MQIWRGIIHVRGCDSVSVPPNLTAMPQSLQYKQQPRACHVVLSVYRCFQNPASSWSTQLYEVFHFLYTHLPKQVTYCISFSNYPVFCTLFALVSFVHIPPLLYKHATSLVKLFSITCFFSRCSYLPLC